MNREDLSNPIIKTAINALYVGDRKTWLSLFAPKATLTDDGNKRNPIEWSDSELFGKGNGRLTAIDKEENNGLTVIALFHSNVWGEFKSYWTFELDGDKITRLQVGQVTT